MHDLLFFDNAQTKAQQTRFYGVFRTSTNLPNVIVPTLGALAITLFGTTTAVWTVTAFIGAFMLLILVERKK